MTTDKDEIRDEFSPLLDDELAPDERADIEQNLAEDAELLRELDGLRKVDELYRQLPSERAPDRFEERVRGALEPRTVQFTRRRLSRRALWPVAAAAAMFLVFAGVLVTQFDGPLEQAMQMASAPDAAESELADRAVAKGPDRQSFGRGRQGEPPPPAPARAVAPSEDADAGYAVNDTIAAGISEEPLAFEEKPEEGKALAKVETAEMREPPSVEGTESLAAKPTEQEIRMGVDFKVAGDPVVKGTEVIRKIGGREFRLRTLSASTPVSRGKEDRAILSKDKTWVEEGYNDEKPRKLERGSETLAQLLAKHKELEKLLELGESVVFRIDKLWYRLAPKPKETAEKNDGQP